MSQQYVLLSRSRPQNILKDKGPINIFFLFYRYFYCERGDRLTTLSCQGGKIFDGRTCVNSSQYICGAPPIDTVENDGKKCERDGFFVQQGSECKRYYFCVSGTRTFLTCPADQIFNGQICVANTQYTCPGWDSKYENERANSLVFITQSEKEEIWSITNVPDYLYRLWIRYIWNCLCDNTVCIIRSLKQFF